MNKFRLYWLDGKIEDIEGDTISDAFTRAGYGGGALPALDDWKPMNGLHAKIELEIKKQLNRDCNHHPYIPTRSRHFGEFILHETEHAFSVEYSVFMHRNHDLKMIYFAGKVHDVGAFLTLIATLEVHAVDLIQV